MPNPLFIAEVSSNHNGNLERCLEFVRVAAEIGCDGIKFQAFQITKLFAPEALTAKPELQQRRAWELPVAYLPKIKEACLKYNLQLGCTPFDVDSAVAVAPYLDFIKIASYNLLDWKLLRACANLNKRLVISTGMGDPYEIADALQTIKRYKNDVTLLHCVSQYPTSLQDCNLAHIDILRARYGVKVGWSDHSHNQTVIYSVVMRHNVSMVEFHLDLDGLGDEFNFGHCWFPDEIQPIITGCRALSIIDGDGNKSILSPSEQQERLWRADPSDGLRPVKIMRERLINAKL